MCRPPFFKSIFLNQPSWDYQPSTPPSVAPKRSEGGSISNKYMIATKDSFELHSSESRTAGPKSKRVYVKGKLHPGVRVPMREIELTPTRSYTGAIERRS